ncbi:MAG: protein translocase subunit SecF [Elusimicrobia bacterium]|nr:protein translocase subunit SecF [Elusimicrobiota bacterium]
MQIISKTHFDFIGARYKLFAVSAALLAASVASLMTRGVNYGIDFTGGTVIQVTFLEAMPAGQLRSALDKTGLKGASIQSFGGENGYAIRVKAEAEMSAQALEDEIKALSAAVAPAQFKVDRKEFVGPAVGRDLFSKALWAIVLSLGGIIVYVAFRFSNPVWGLAGVLALGHDVLATYGLFSWTQAEVDLVIVAALLTIAGYSINDTIVIFDRMRENLRLMRGASMDEIINTSINETLSRTIITNATVLSVVLILFFFGGKVIHNFAMAMVFGAVVGTYSTIALAAPLVYEWAVRMGGAKREALSKPQPKAAGKGR